MQPALVEKAIRIVPNYSTLINVVAKRVRQLAQGDRPLVEVEPQMVYSDIALKELIEGKLTVREGDVVFVQGK